MLSTGGVLPACLWEHSPPTSQVPFPRAAPVCQPWAPVRSWGPWFGGWPLSGCLLWLLLYPHCQPHSHSAASGPFAVFSMAPRLGEAGDTWSHSPMPTGPQR